jgi:PPM family protein phosphatase
VDAANNAGGNDNITAVLVENNNWPKQKPEPVTVERKNNEVTTLGATDEATPIHVITPAKKNGHSPIAFLALVLIGLAAVFLTVAFQKSNKPTATNAIPVQTVKKKNEQLIQLISHVNDSSKTYAFPPGRTILEMADLLVIRKDSFSLVGNGAILTAENLYKGPALLVNSTAKHIVLDSLVFQNFDVGIVVQKNNITFRHVRFINCRIPVQYLLSFPDSVISGRFRDSIFITQSKLK